MTRSNALIKLLALGPMPYSEIILVMGGNRDAAVDSPLWLVKNGVVQRCGSNFKGSFYSLACEA